MKRFERKLLDGGGSRGGARINMVVFLKKLIFNTVLCKIYPWMGDPGLASIFDDYLLERV